MIDGLVTIVLPVYNQKDLLPQAVDSILSQEYAFLELIILNDGSMDNVQEVVERYSDNRIQYYNLSHRGLPEALNYGLRLSKGEFITWFMYKYI